MKTKFISILLTIASLLSGAFVFAQSNSSFVFATNDVVTSGAKLMKIDKSNGTPTIIGSLLFSSSGCAFDPYTQRVYYTEAQSGGTAPFDLAYYDLATNTNTQIGTGVLGSNAFVKLSINPTNGKMYGIESVNSSGKTKENLYEIDKTTGVKTSIGTIMTVTGTANGDLAFDKNGVCYYIAADVVYTLNVTTATATPYVTITPSNTKITGLTIDENLNLLVSTFQNPGGACGGGGDWIAKVNLPSGNLTCIGNANTTLGDLGGGYAVLGMADRLVGATNIGTLYTAVFEIRVQNYGLSTLKNLQIADDLKAIFGTRLINASVAASGSLPTGVTVNSLYNGSTNTSLLATGSSLAFSYPTNTSFVLRVTATLNIPASDNNKFFFIQPVITGTDPAGNLLTDLSDDGINPNANANNSASDAGEDDPTPFSVVTALPVKLTSFTAAETNGKININWKSASESNMVNYVVEASTDGIVFNRIVKVVKPLNLADGADYSITDDQPNNGVNYYRLKMQEAVSVSYSEVRMVTLNNKSLTVQVYPNPASKEIKVQLPVSTKSQVTLQIVGVDGTIAQRVNVNTANGSIFSLNIEKLVKGMYVLQVRDASSAMNVPFVKM